MLLDVYVGEGHFQLVSSLVVIKLPDSTTQVYCYIYDHTHTGTHTYTHTTYCKFYLHRPTLYSTFWPLMIKLTLLLLLSEDLSVKSCQFLLLSTEVTAKFSLQISLKDV